MLFSHTFGHFVIDTELYLCEKYLSKVSSLDLFYREYKYRSHKKPVNHQWDLMVRRSLRLFPFFISYLRRVNRAIPGGRAHHITMGVERSKSRDLKGIFFRTGIQIKFTEDEQERGKKFLQNIGLKSGEKYVCLIVRDSAYKNKYRNWKSDWSYHNYRDSDIKNYRDAVVTLAEKGYWVFRMGKAVHKTLYTENDRILDYANSSYRSDFLDIWLVANCYFTLCTATGLTDLACVFRKPAAIVNSSPLGTISGSNHSTIWLPKKTIWNNNQKPLTLSEQIETGVIGFMRSEEYTNTNVSLIDNTNIEITRAALELESKLNKTWQPEPNDDLLQNKFWSMLKTWKKFPEFQGYIQHRLPDLWLRENHEWFLQ